MHNRMLTAGEKALLRPIFLNTLPYDDQQISDNSREWGGHTNSITPNYMPYMALSFWTHDFTSATYANKWIFIHEMTHAWQWYHGQNNILSAIALWRDAQSQGKDYDNMYDYNLDDFERFSDFNFEQQASIVADYWYLTENLKKDQLNLIPQQNKGMRARLQDYKPFISQLQSAGPPRRQPYIDHSKDWQLQRHGP